MRLRAKNITIGNLGHPSKKPSKNNWTRGSILFIFPHASDAKSELKTEYRNVVLALHSSHSFTCQTERTEDRYRSIHSVHTSNHRHHFDSTGFSRTLTSPLLAVGSLDQQVPTPCQLRTKSIVYRQGGWLSYPKVSVFSKKPHYLTWISWKMPAIELHPI